MNILSFHVKQTTWEFFHSPLSVPNLTLINMNISSKKQQKLVSFHVSDGDAYLHKAIPKVDAISKIGAGDVTV